MEIKILELFGGIGACTKAFKRLGIPYHIADYVEIDKYAVKSYNAINGTNFEPRDIREWNKDIKVDLIMHGSPCQSISLAGLQHGADKGSGTRSSLMWETVRIVEKLKPKYVIWENVKNLLSKKHIHNFNAYLETMEQLGYTNYYQVLNAKDYGIPQNRERVFTISIRKDISKTFVFPQPQELKKLLVDMLEDEVEEKYYLSKRIIDFYIFNTEQQKQKGNGFSFNPITKNEAKISKTITTRAGSRMDDNFITNKPLRETLDKYRDKIIKNYQFIDSYNRTIRHDNKTCTISTRIDASNNSWVIDDFKIRKLTPRECWRLMGFDDEDCDKAAQVNSNTQLYKQAGNSIVVNVLEAILTNLLLKTNQEICKGQMTIFDYEGNI